MKDIVLDKTHYMYFYTCPRYGWHKFRFPDDLEEDKPQLLQYQQGEGTEIRALDLFENIWNIDGDRKTCLELTEKYIADPKINGLYQATVLSKSNLLAKADIITLNHHQKTIDIYEVKSVSNLGFGENENKKKEPDKARRYINDIGFQKIAFEDSGYKIDKTFLININKSYCKKQEGAIKAAELLKITEVSEADFELEEQAIKKRIEAAQQAYAQNKPPACTCFQKSKSKRCPFWQKFNPQIPESNSIYQLTGIKINKITNLLKDNIIKIEDIDLSGDKRLKPDSNFFSTYQLNQIRSVKNQQILIDYKVIEGKLKSLQSPIYFLDYEAINYGIPVFLNSKPFEQIPIQYSLHVLNKAGKLEHHEYILQDASFKELEKMLKELKKQLGQKGSILVWHDSAEIQFNNNLKNIMPEYSDWLDEINLRIEDLKKFFRAGYEAEYYVHPQFEGQASIKKILPAIIPDLNYKNLEIQDGRTASTKWDEAQISLPEEKKKIYKNLLDYCRQDTLGMVKIYEHLLKIVKNKNPTYAALDTSLLANKPRLGLVKECDLSKELLDQIRKLQKDEMTAV